MVLPLFSEFVKSVRSPDESENPDAARPIVQAMHTELIAKVHSLTYSFSHSFSINRTNHRMNQAKQRASRATISRGTSATSQPSLTSSAGGTRTNGTPRVPAPTVQLSTPEPSGTLSPRSPTSPRQQNVTSPSGKRRSVIESLQLMIPAGLMPDSESKGSAQARALASLISPRKEIVIVPNSTTAPSTTLDSAVEETGMSAILRFEKDNRALRLENQKLLARVAKLEVHDRPPSIFVLQTRSTCLSTSLYLIGVETSET